MSYASASPSFSLFPTSPGAPQPFNIFSIPQSPRETHALFEDLISIFKPASTTSPEPRKVLQSLSSGEKCLKRSRSTPSFKKSWRKLFGLEPTEPSFEFIMPQSRPDTPPSEEDAASSDGSTLDEDFGILSKSNVLDAIPREEDKSSSDGTLVGEELASVVRADSPSIYSMD